MDFGLATRSHGGLGREALTTPLSGRILGTVPYLSPEQIVGELVDARADLYSLGCMLYESLVGWPPFNEGSVHAILNAHQAQSPELPSTYVHGVPAELERLVMQLLTKARHQRIGYAHDVAEALSRVASGPVLKPVSSTEASSRPYLYRPRLAGRIGALEAIESTQRELDRGSGCLLLIEGKAASARRP